MRMLPDCKRMSFRWCTRVPDAAELAGEVQEPVEVKKEVP